MIYTEDFLHDGRLLRKTFSDTYYIERDGQIYGEAIDPAELDRVYLETNIPLEEENLPKEDEEMSEDYLDQENQEEE